MNLVDAEVTAVLGSPKQKYGKWFVKVKYDSWGSENETEIMLRSEDEALKIKPGYKFLT